MFVLIVKLLCPYRVLRYRNISYWYCNKVISVNTVESRNELVAGMRFEAEGCSLASVTVRHHAVVVR